MALNITPEEHNVHAGQAESPHYTLGLHAFLVRNAHRPEKFDALLQAVYVRLLQTDCADLAADPRGLILQWASDVLRESSQDEATQSPSSGSPVYDAPAERLSTPEQLSAAIRQLPIVSQAVLLLFYREKSSTAQIARTLKMSASRAENHLSQAKRELMAIDWHWD
jgi:DNA-directed RNA polymerase specialized sigma24 family protein